MAFTLSALKRNPEVIPSISLVPGLVLIKSINITQAPTSQAGLALATITIDAPHDATFAKYRKILFSFYGIGFSNTTATDINLTPRRTGRNFGTTIYYQINQISSVTATGWVNTSASTTVPLTAGTIFTNNVVINKLDIEMHPLGHDVVLSASSIGTTIPAGGLIRTTGGYSQPGVFQNPIPLNENPGLTLSLTAANLFTTARATSLLTQLPITCDIYGVFKS